MIEAATTFDEAWETADEITGWLSKAEAAALWDAAQLTPIDGVIVEVGSFCGRSTTILAETGRKVIAFDPLVLGQSIAKTPIDESVVDSLRSVVAKYDNVIWHRCKSDEGPIPPRIDLLHIDACHKYPHPLVDYMRFADSLRPGSLVAFHDYWREFGVTKAVTELEKWGDISKINVAEVMYVGEVQ